MCGVLLRPRFVCRFLQCHVKQGYLHEIMLGFKVAALID